MMANKRLDRLHELNVVLDERERAFASRLEVVSVDVPSLLIVDDDAGLRRTLGDILLSKGYATEGVATAREAIGRLRTQFYNVVLLDYKLPDLPMDDVLEAIKEHYPFTATIIITGYPSWTTATSCAGLGVNGYMEKPVDIDALLCYIKKVLAQQRRLWKRLRALPITA